MEIQSIRSKKIISIIILNAGNLAWYFVIRQQFDTLFQVSSGDETWIYIGSTLFYLFAAISAIIGCTLTSKVNHKKFLWSWITFGIVTHVCLILFREEFASLIFGPLLGISLGLGLPYSLTLLSDFVNIEKRGRISGIYLLVTFIIIATAMLANIVSDLDLIGTIIVLLLIRSTGFSGLIFDKCIVKTKVNHMRRKGSWFTVLKKRNFILYFFPWLLFLIAVVLTDHLIWADLQRNADYERIMEFGRPLNYAGTAIFGFVSGIIVDRFGRKIPIYLGLMILGFSFALLGIVPSVITVFVHMMTIGIAFGFLIVSYTVIPGDIAELNFLSGSKDKFYALIGVVPLTIYGGIGSLPRAFNLTASASIFSPILSVILFMSLLPISQAPETLQPDIMEKRKIEDHMKKVIEIVGEEKEKENS